MIILLASVVLLGIAVLVNKHKGSKANDNPSLPPLNPTDTYRFQNEPQRTAASHIGKGQHYLELACTTTSISAFDKLYKLATQEFSKAQALENSIGIPDEERPSHILAKLEQDYQAQLKKAIKREEDSLIQLMKVIQHDKQIDICIRYSNSIKKLKDSFSDETLKFALDSYQHVVATTDNQESMPSVESVLSSSAEAVITPITSVLTKVDGMSGLEFEHYCAELLSKNGFSNVSVTSASGDQGIDILAVKDDINYAIQCKCYSSNLGNKPIQEAHAGKSIYKCQVAAVLTNRYFTQSGIEAATATGVLLWDRDKLISLIETALHK